MALHNVIIKKKRPHFEWVEYHLQRGLFTGARVILAATLKHELDEADKN